MKYYSTNKKASFATLQEAVIKGLAPDKGLYMPERIPTLSQEFFHDIDKMSFQDIAFHVAEAFFGEDIDKTQLKTIVEETLSFDCPIVPIKDKIYALELFHGPTLAFKDVGARFMARLLQHFLQKDKNQEVNVLVATSGDTGSAVANGFLGVKGIHVYVLYPKGKVSKIQECQFTTLGENITAIEVDGTFDDCQRLVKEAFISPTLNKEYNLTSANSINVARFLPQSFYYFYAYAQMKRMGIEKELVISVPSGNFGNLTAALFAHRMGLPIKRFIAANNANDVFLQYLKTGIYDPQASIQTIANAMDVGNPSNFARMLDMYGQSLERMRELISAYSFTDSNIRATILQCYKETGYILDPHGACGYRSLELALEPTEYGIFCETAHPAKFKNVIEETLNTPIFIPEKLQKFMQGTKKTIEIDSEGPIPFIDRKS